MINVDLASSGNLSKLDSVGYLRTLLRRDAGFSVHRETTEIINVRNSNVWLGVMQAKIEDLRLPSYLPYNPDAAIAAAIRASESSLREIKARPLTLVRVGLMAEPFEDMPHLSATARYSTISDLLNDVVRTFGGVLVYSECSLPDGYHLFDMDFFRRQVTQ